MSYDEHLISMAGGDGDNDMAGVLAEHREPSWRAGHGGWDCKCGHTLTTEYPSLFPREVHEQHVATVLSAAGFGLVRESQAVALEEAADEADGVIAAGDIAEVAAYCPGESGRNAAIAARDSLYEDGPGDFLRARAVTVRGGE